MMNTALVARFQQLWGRRVASAAQHTPMTTLAPLPVSASMTLTMANLDSIRRISSLQVKGVLNRCTDEAFVTSATALYRQGCRRLVVDLTTTTHLDLAGRFALYNVARLFADEGLLNPEDGWAVLHRADETVAADLGERVKLVALPTLAALIRQSTICRDLPIYPTLVLASAAFSPFPV